VQQSGQTKNAAMLRFIVLGHGIADQTWIPAASAAFFV